MRRASLDRPMPITRVEWQGVCVPFRRPFVTARGQTSLRHGLLLFIHTDQGPVGIGEASPIDIDGGEASLHRLADVLDGVAKRLLGVSLGEFPKVSGANLRDGPVAKTLRFGLETAAYDALGKASGVPVAALLGTEPRAILVNAVIGAEVPSEAARLALEAKAQGFTSLKLKVTGGPEDIAMLEAVRGAVGDQVQLRVDANQAWSVEEAIIAISRLERFRLEYVEQPVAAMDIPGMAQVRRRVRVPIAADESVGDISEARRVLDAAAADFLVLKAARVGGLKEAQAILQLAGERSVPAVVTTSLETGIGIAASLHLAASAQPGGPACGLATGPLLESDLLTDPLLPMGGLLRVPETPGLGVSLNAEALGRYSLNLCGVATA